MLTIEFQCLRMPGSQFARLSKRFVLVLVCESLL